MTSREFVIKLEQFQQTLPEVRDKLILDAVFSAAALVKARVIRSRASADGDIFAKYSPKYLQKRIKAGKGPDDRINFSYSGKMWQATQPFIVETSTDQVTVRVQPIDDQRKEVMGYHDKRFGPILTLNEDEINGITQDFAAGVQEFMNEHFKG